MNMSQREAAAAHLRRLMSQQEAADYLRLSIRGLERGRVRGDGPPYAKLGRRVVYRQADLDAWVAAHVVANTSVEVRR